MRQVPRYCLLGAGKMAQHFAHYLSLLNIPYTAYSRSQITPECIKRETKAADKICLLISDSAILPFINQYELNHHPKIVHFSGSLVIDGCYSTHPLMTFGSSLYDLPDYKAFPFIIEQEGAAFDTLLPGIPNHHFSIPQQLKPFYHALCVMGGNFSCLLWQKYFQALEENFNIPIKDAFPYMKTIFQNLANNPTAALTGPLARKDDTTIQANLSALHHQSDPFYSIYQAFVSTYPSLKLEDNT